MKKYSAMLLIVGFFWSSAQHLAFKGADFENFTDFQNSLNHYGLKDYVTQDSGSGFENSAALKITARPSANDYLFTAKPTESLPVLIKNITFLVKGTASKSLSINLYKIDGSFYNFNVGDLKKDSDIEVTDKNNYSGIINTGDHYVKVTLDCAKLKDINRDVAKNFIAFKVGKDAAYDIEIDNILVNGAE